MKTKKKTATNLVGDAVSSLLGGGEDDGLIVLLAVDVLEKAHELGVLLGLEANVDDLGNPVVGRNLPGPDVNLVVVGEEVPGQGLHLLGPSGAPHEGLPIRADLGHNLPDLGLKTHVKHPVGLVHDEIGDPAEVGLAHFEQIDEAAWSGDADLDSALEVPDLSALGDTAVEAGVLDPG